MRHDPVRERQQTVPRHLQTRTGCGGLRGATRRVRVPRGSLGIGQVLVPAPHPPRRDSEQRARRGARARPPHPLEPQGALLPPSRRCGVPRSEEHTSELQSLMRISYAVFCLKKKNKTNQKKQTTLI